MPNAQTYMLMTQIEVPHPTEDFAYPTIEIEFGYAPAPHTFSDEPPEAPDVWLVSARLAKDDPDAVTAAPPDVVASWARSYLESHHGYENAVATAEG
jgi:hypothetical protein